MASHSTGGLFLESMISFLVVQSEDIMRRAFCKTTVMQVLVGYLRCYAPPDGTGRKTSKRKRTGRKHISAPPVGDSTPPGKELRQRAGQRRGTPPPGSRFFGLPLADAAR